ncbi:hypothetical protein PM082_009559 [Marasmius tenuissimus]|nr:hypothetical protein PM082_009559 [Marasmius tenuissimus]
MCRQIILLLSAFGYTRLGAGATVFFETSPTLPKTTTFSQSITENRSCTDLFSTPFNFELVHVDSNSHAISTHTLVDHATGNPEAGNPVRGAIDFAAPTTKSVEVVAVVTIPRVLDILGATSVSTLLSNIMMDVGGAPTLSSLEILTSQDSESQTAETLSNSSPLAKPPTTTLTASTQSAKDENPSAKIFGSVIGGAVFLMSGVMLGLLLRRRCRPRERRSNPEGFCRDRMVAKRVETDVGAKYPIRKNGLGGFAGTGRHFEPHPIRSATTFQENYKGDQLDNRPSLSSSISHCSSEGKRLLALSGISGMGPVSSEVSKVPIPPPIPISANPPPSPAHSRTPSRARTDRQMQIEQKILELQGLFITVHGSVEEKNRVRADLQERIENLKGIRESEWAYGGKGEVLEDLRD